MDIRLSGHTAYCTEYHIVWIPKYRHRILNPGVKGYLVKLFPKVMEQLPGCEIIKCNIQPDHIHIVMIIPPKYAVSAVIGKMKGIVDRQPIWKHSELVFEKRQVIPDLQELLASYSKPR